MADFMYFEELRPFSTFSTVHNKDRFVRYAVSAFHLTGSLLKVWFCLSSKSAGRGTVGVSKIKYETIAKLTKLSVSTVRRSITRLVDLGILRKENTIRKRGGDGANIYVIVPTGEHADEHAKMNMRDEGKKPEETMDKLSFSDSQEYFSLNNAISKEEVVYNVREDIEDEKKKSETDQSEELGYTYGHQDIPKDIIRSIVPIARSAKFINLVWSKVNLALRLSNVNTNRYSLTEILKNNDFRCNLIHRIKVCVNAVKTGKAQSFWALLYWHAKEAFNDLAEEMNAQIRRTSGYILYDWINA